MDAPISFVWLAQNQKLVLSRPERVARVVDIDYIEHSGFNVKGKDMYSGLCSIKCNHCETVKTAPTLYGLSQLVLIPDEFVSVLYRVDAIDPDMLESRWYMRLYTYFDITVCGACLVTILQSEELRQLQCTIFPSMSKIPKSALSLSNRSHGYLNAMQQLLLPIFPVVLIRLVFEYLVYFVDEQLLLLYFFKQPNRVAADWRFKERWGLR